MSTWGKSAAKHQVSTRFGGNPKKLFALFALCDGDAKRFGERLEQYHRECAQLRHAPSVDELAKNLEKIRHANGRANGAPRNGARNGALARPLLVSTREAFERGAVRRGDA